MTTSATPATVLLARLLARARFRHLQLFAKLAEMGSLKRAAEALHVSQPAATQLLADLERLVELPLFDRHARGVRITTAGKALLPTARRALDALADASDAVTAAKHQGEGVVQIAAITGGVAGLLAQLLPAFARAEPKMQIQVIECEADRCAELVFQRQVDLAVCREPAALPANCVFQPQLQDRFVVACGLHHPLAKRRRVGWSTLAGECWLLSPVQSAARRAFDEQMLSLAATPRVSPVVTRVSSLTWAMLEGDRLLTLVPYGVVKQLVDAGRLAVVDAVPSLPFAPLGWLLPADGPSAATQRLLTHFETALQPDGLTFNPDPSQP